MPVVRVAEFGRFGLNVDRQDTLLQPGEWSSLENIDLENGDIRSAWGDSRVTNPPVVPRYGIVFEDANVTWLIVSDGTKIFAFNGSTWTEITPSTTPITTDSYQDLINAATKYSDLLSTSYNDLTSGGTPITLAGDLHFAVFLGTLVCCPSEGIPTYWPGSSGQMVKLPGWDDAWRAQEIHAFGNFLVAIGFDDGTVEGAKWRVAWSDAAAEGEVPQTWTPTPENLAGSVQLRDSDGYLTTAKILRDDLIVFKQDSIYRMYLRADIVFGFERVVSDRGCDSPRGVANLDDALYFSDRGDIRIFNGQITASVAAFKIRDSLIRAISNEYRDKTIVLAYPEREEIWVGVIPYDQDTVSEVLVYNLEHKAWTRKSYPGTLLMLVGPFSGSTVSTTRTYQDLLDAGFTYEIWTDSYGESRYEPSEDGVLFGVSGAIFRADKTNTDYNGLAKYCRAERTGFLLAGIEQRVTVKAIYPEMEGSADVQIEVGTQWYKGAPVHWTAPRMFSPTNQRKLNVRTTGIPCGIRITSQSSNGWRLGALSFDLVEASRR